MSWKKYFKTPSNKISPIGGASPGGGNPGFKNYQTNLPDVYVGHPNRIERYNQYEQMDMDVEVNAALDVLSEFSTQTNIENGTIFDINFVKEPSDNEVNIIKDQLANWTSLNEFKKRAFRMFRNTLKYGDQVFIRDPETFKLYWVNMAEVVKVIVNESEGKEPEQYVVKNLAPNLENLAATQKPVSDLYLNQNQAGYNTPGYQQPTAAGTSGGRFDMQQNEVAIDAEHIVHLSLTEGLDVTWPFGTSVLEQVFKVYKQKELLEDAILIYRIQRAPERRVFKIDVGNMPSHMAMQFVERVKNEIHQRRIPSQTGDGATMMDGTYNPLSINEDYFFPVTADGRGSNVDVLPGGDNLGEINDLQYFNNKLVRGLRIPSSYLPTGPDESERSYSDGRTGTALIQEWRFNQYCMRLQSLMAEVLDKEFKMFLNWRGINIDNSIFDLRLNEPQNFAAYSQADVDSVRMSTFGQVAELPYMSKRFAMKRYMGMTEEEMVENTKLWEEEQGQVEGQGATTEADLRAAGVSPGGIEGDIDTFDELEGELDDIDMGGEDMGDLGGADDSAETPLDI
jgi:hypothetical protein